MIEDFTGAFKSVKTYRADFKKDLCFADGLKLSDGEMVLSPVFTATEKPVQTVTGEDDFFECGAGVFGFIKRNGRYFLIGEDGQEKQVLEGGFKCLPQAVEVFYRGKKSAFLFFCGNALSLENPYDLLPVIKGENYVFSDGTLYCTDGDGVLFDGPFGYPTVKKDENDGGVIRFKGEKITGLAVSRYVFAFTKEKVYSFSVASDAPDYSVSTVLESKCVRGESAAAYKNGCLFICGKDLMFSDGKTAKTVFENFLPYGYKPKMKPQVSGGEYYLPVYNADGDKKIAVFDGENRYFADACGFTLLNPFAAIKDGIKYSLKAGEGFRKFISENLSLNSDRLKSVCGVKAEVYGEELYMTVAGDFGEKTYAIKDGNNFLRVSLSSKKYRVTVYGKIKAIKNIELYFRNREVLYGI